MFSIRNHLTERALRCCIGKQIFLHCILALFLALFSQDPAHSWQDLSAMLDKFVATLDGNAKLDGQIADSALGRLGPSWGRLGPSWGRLGRERGQVILLGTSWAVFSHLGPSWRRLGPSWGHLGGVLGPKLGVLGAKTSPKILPRRPMMPLRCFQDSPRSDFQQKSKEK